MPASLAPPIPQPSLDPEWSTIGTRARRHVTRWLCALRNVRDWSWGGGAYQQIAEQLGLGQSTVRRIIKELKATGDWYALVDERLLPKQQPGEGGFTDPAFINHFQSLCCANARCTAAAIRELRRQWRDREPIPGYPGHPGWPDLPESWSHRNLYRIAPPDDQLAASRQGMRSARAKHLPQVRTTRTKLWQASHYQFDDVWHDHYVRVATKGEKTQVTRVLELGALDVFSACRFHWGCKPRVRKADGTHAGLLGAEMRWFLAELLTRFGYSERGTELLLEHGTAALPEELDALLYEHTGQCVTVQRTGIEGDTQALLGWWGGKGKGNPRAKAHLESLHNLIHNELGFIAGQSGNDRTEVEHVGTEEKLELSAAPACVKRRLQDFLKGGHRLPLVPYQQRLLELIEHLPDASADCLVHPLLEFHTQFYPLLCALYDDAINGRTDHDLEGWLELGFETIEYWDAEAGQWLLEEAVHALPAPRAARVLSIARGAVLEGKPHHFTRPRRLSPGEVWARRDGMRLLPWFAALDIIGRDLAKPRKVTAGYFEWEDKRVSPIPLRYPARVVHPETRAAIELPEGERFNVFANPYAPELLAVCDSRHQLLGLAQRAHRADRGSTGEMLAAYKEREERTAERLAPMREREAPTVTIHQAMLHHNRTELTEASGIAEERRSAAAKDAAAKRLSERTTADRKRDLV